MTSHTTLTLAEDVEERFEEKFVSFNNVYADTNELKQFIAAEIDRVRQETLDATSKVIFDFMYTDLANLGSADDDDASQEITSKLMNRIEEALQALSEQGKK